MVSLWCSGYGLGEVPVGSFRHEIRCLEADVREGGGANDLHSAVQHVGVKRAGVADWTRSRDLSAGERRRP